MILKKTKEGIVGECQVDGLVKATFTYPAENPKANSTYEGPTINPEVWAEVLAFFKWTYDEYKSESQVRLYVNPKLKEWRAWAFPQEADTGMTAKEFEREETAAEAKARFEEWGVAQSGDWYYFGTAHHHCGCSAFQSGTDEANEKGQDGIHITVGNMGSKLFDIDYRFYLGGIKFDAKLTMFWDVGDAVRAIIPADLCTNVAKYQMGKLADGASFPNAWKENVIKRETVSLPNTGSALGLGKGDYRDYSANGYTGGYYAKTWTDRIEAVLAAVFEAAAEMQMDFEEVKSWFEDMETEPLAQTLFKALKEERVDFEDLARYFPAAEHDAVKLMAQTELQEDLRKGRRNKRGKEESGGSSPNGETDQQEFRHYMD